MKVRKSNRGYAKAAIERAGCDACISISEREQVRRKATAPYDTAEFFKKEPTPDPSLNGGEKGAPKE